MAQSRQRKVPKEGIQKFGALRSEDWFSPHDDRLLIRAVQRGFTADTIARTVKFSVNYTKEEISERWKNLLYNEEVAKRVAPMVIKVSRVSMKRVPWKKKEDKIIKKELKEHGFVSFAHLLHRRRTDFHCSRTVSSLESHFWSLKKRGFFKDIPILNRRTGTRVTESSKEDKKKKRGKKGKKIDEAEIKRDARTAAKLEKILKLKKPIVLDDIPKNAFACLDGVNARLFLCKRVCSIGKRMKSIVPDLDLSLEGKATRIVGRQAEIVSTRSNFGMDFLIRNFSKKPLYVGDNKVLKGMTNELTHNCILSFPGGLKIKFCEIKERTKKSIQKPTGITPVNIIRPPQMLLQPQIQVPQMFPRVVQPPPQMLPQPAGHVLPPPKEV